MYAIEFEADVVNGSIKLPEKYKGLEARHLKAIILLPDDKADLQSGYDFSDIVGKLSWKGDVLEEQRRLRDEWT